MLPCLGCRAQGYFSTTLPKGPCIQTVYTLALKKSLHRRFGPDIFTIVDDINRA